VTDAAFDKMLRAWFGNITRALVPGRGFYIWGGYANCANYPPAMKECNLYFSQAIIWVKEHPVLTRKDFMGNHEWCFYGWKEGAAHYFAEGLNNIPDIWEVAPATEAHAPHAALGEGLLVEPPGDASPVFVTPHVPKCKVRTLKLGTAKAATFHLDGPTDIWRIKKVSPNKMVHLTEKPVELAVRAMHYSSRRGENVLDLFGGSGSTLMAAELAGRRAFLMELDPPYCDVIVQRWEQYTGKKAERIAAPARLPADT
jgi:DNA modification methylase